MVIKSIIGVILGVTLVQASHAATTTYSWTGTIVGVDVDTGTGIYTGTQVSDNFSGVFTYDPDVNNIIGLDTSDGDPIIEVDDTWVEYFLGSGSGTVTNGITQVSGNNATLSITDDHADSIFDEQADGWGLDFSTGNFEVIVEYGSLLTDMYDDLSFRPTAPWSPPTMPDDPDNQSALFEIFELDGSGNEIFSAYGVITMSTVPVPAAVWLFGSGLIGLIIAARRKARV